MEGMCKQPCFWSDGIARPLGRVKPVERALRLYLMDISSLDLGKRAGGATGP